MPIRFSPAITVQIPLPSCLARETNRAPRVRQILTPRMRHDGGGEDLHFNDLTCFIHQHAAVTESNRSTGQARGAFRCGSSEKTRNAAC